jgi:nucleotide-binding universal stress UspA family protein
MTDDEPEDFTMHHQLLRHAEEHLAKAKDEADRAGWQEVVDHLNTKEASYA